MLRPASGSRRTAASRCAEPPPGSCNKDDERRRRRGCVGAADAVAGAGGADDDVAGAGVSVAASGGGTACGGAPVVGSAEACRKRSAASGAGTRASIGGRSGRFGPGGGSVGERPRGSPPSMSRTAAEDCSGATTAGSDLLWHRLGCRSGAPRRAATEPAQRRRSGCGRSRRMDQRWRVCPARAMMGGPRSGLRCPGTARRSQPCTGVREIFLSPRRPWVSTQAWISGPGAGDGVDGESARSRSPARARRCAAPCAIPRVRSWASLVAGRGGADDDAVGLRGHPREAPPSPVAAAGGCTGRPLGIEDPARPEG